MSVVGIDFGTQYTVVAVARKKGVDVICNQVSSRLTPGLVSFGANRRHLGESAQAHVISNIKNTVASLKRFLERKIDDPELEFEKRFCTADIVDSNGLAAVEVVVNNEKKVFSFIQLIAMFLTDVKDFASKEVGMPVTNIVISCPVWYTDVQKRALVDAAVVAGMETFIVINDLSAVALSYALTRVDLPLSTAKSVSPRKVLFFDMGNSSTQVCVTSFYSDKSNVLAQSCNRCIGGRNIDDILARHYAAEFSKKYNVDILSNQKSMLRLTQACEKVKKILSANLVTNLSVEFLAGDIDVSVPVSREELEELIMPLAEGIMAPVVEALTTANLTEKDIDFVELVGGSTRVPLVRKLLTDMFGQSKISTTLNLDEAVARGCAINCAIISPAFKVREHTFVDWNPYPIELSWDSKYSSQAPKGGSKWIKTLVFPKGNAMPSTKMLTLFRSTNNNEPPKEDNTYDIDIYGHYSPEIDGMNIIDIKSKFLSKFTISGIKKLKEDDKKMTIKIQIRLGASGILQADSAYQAEEVMETVPDDSQAPPSPTKTSDDTAARNEKPEKESEPNSSENSEEEDKSKPDDMEVESKEQKKIEPKYKVVKVERKHPLKLISYSNRKLPELVEEYKNLEAQLRARDQLTFDTEEMRNQLEEYIYDSRSHVTGTWKDFVKPGEDQALIKATEEVEAWIYDQECDLTLEDYREKLTYLQSFGDCIQARYDEHQKRLREEENKRIEEERKLKEAIAREEKEKEEAKNENGEMKQENGEQANEPGPEPEIEEVNTSNSGENGADDMSCSEGSCE